MSYILDALRRAEAERERGAVPSLQSQQHSIESEDDAPERSRLLVWMVFALAFALIATLAWTLLGGSGSPARPIAEGPVNPAPVAAPVASAAPVAQSLAEIAAMPSPSTALPPQAPARRPVPVPLPPPRPATATATATANAAAKATAPVPLAAPKAAAPTPVAAAASEPRVYAQSELPEEIRREIPRVAINGSSYSGDAASRMVMINGQVFHEGDQLATGLVLDKIKRRSAVLAYKGWRYEIMF